MNKVTIIITLILSLISSCTKTPSNNLIGEWHSEENLLTALNPNSKKFKIQFTANEMKINSKTIPIIYKLKSKIETVIFTKGEKLIVRHLSNKRIALKLNDVGVLYLVRNEL